MYLYFLPLSPANNANQSNTGFVVPSNRESIIPTPTPDGGIEHTAARFLPCSAWLSKCRSGEIILFPPQFYLMHLLAPMLEQLSVASPTAEPLEPEQLQKQRDAVLAFLQEGKPRWADRCISPTGVIRLRDQRIVLVLDRLAPELKGTGRTGDSERVVTVRFQKEGPRDVEVRWKRELFEEMRGQVKL
jgi:hypothetical protein